MATLGTPYTMMYLSTGVSGLTDVYAFVRKPDNSVVGKFSFVEGVGAFTGCYFGEYYSSIDDPEGAYFARVFSPSENKIDAIRFDLDKPADGSGDFYIPPSNLIGVLKDSKLSAIIRNDLELDACVETNELKGALVQDNVVTGCVENHAVEGDVKPSVTTGVIEGC